MIFFLRIPNFKILCASGELLQVQQAHSDTQKKQRKSLSLSSHPRGNVQEMPPEDSSLRP